MSMPKPSPNKSNSDKQFQEDTSLIRKASIGYAELFSGPIPPALELGKYENVLPGAANRILKMAEKQSAHRQELENKMLEANIKAEKVGQLLGFIIFGLAIIAGFVLIMFGKDIVGLVALISSIGGVIGLFVYNRVEAKKELKEKGRKK